MDNLAKRPISVYPHVERFLAEYSPLICACCKDTRIFPSVAIAQAALESEWGQKAGATLFGVKGTGPAGSVTTMTKEEIKGKVVDLPDQFRAYPTREAAVRDYLKVLTTLPRYKRALRAKSPARQILEIWRGGYCTDSKYVYQIIDVIDDFDLVYFDGERA